MKKKVISTILAVSMVCGIGFNVVATPLTDNQKQEMQDNQKKYLEINDKIRSLEIEIDKLTDKIDPIFEEVEANNIEIEKTKKDIEIVEKQIEQARLDIEKQQEILGGRIRATYKSGVQNSYISILLSSDDIGDLLTKAKTISKIMNIDKVLIDELSSKKEELDAKVLILENKTAELDNLNKVNQAKIDELNKMVDEQQTVVDNMQSEKKKIVGYLAPLERELIKPYVDMVKSSSSIDELNNAINSLSGLRNQIETPEVDKEAINAIEKAKKLVAEKKAALEAEKIPNRGDGATSGNSSGNTSGNVSGNVSGNASSIISYAYQFIGKPYVYGATGPNSFDCSGFTQYVFKKFGYNITRTTKTQVKQGRYVSRDQLQPGDLVFTRGSAASPGHVGIYVGNGQMVHASRPGVGVIVGPIYDYVTSRRVL